MSTALRTRSTGTTDDGYCPGCSTDMPFETPPCDEHGGDCPELACVICGWALVGPFEVAALSPTRVAAAAV
jgi:hypothetical protein